MNGWLLAPISKIEKNRVPDVLRQVFARVEAEVPALEQRNFLAAMYSLMGSCYPANFVKSLIKDLSAMRESTFVQMWIDEGLEQGSTKTARNAVLCVLHERFGEFDGDVDVQLAKISDKVQLGELLKFAVKDRSIKTFRARLKDLAVD
jgi:hypothetical protein